jgi:phage terminase Nu1 subunit (DNA packaging protein)
VTLRQAETIVGRSRRTVLAWQANGMPTEKLGGVGHVRVSDLLAWQRDHGRRHGRARDYL